MSCKYFLLNKALILYFPMINELFVKKIVSPLSNIMKTYYYTAVSQAIK